jgi:phospholipid N-methyltransferase
VTFAAVPLFCKEFVRSFKTTGAVLPSGRALAKALVAPLIGIPGPRIILEAGPGTGAVTHLLLKHLAAGDQLVLCEINPQFADFLGKRFEEDPDWQPYRSQVQLVREDVRQLLTAGRYDFVLSGLPLNNFSPGLVSEILSGFLTSLTSKGVHTFFEYILVREFRMRIGTQEERTRMAGIHEAVRSAFVGMQWRRSAILLNVPPAWAYAVHQYLAPIGSDSVPSLADQ